MRVRVWLLAALLVGVIPSVLAQDQRQEAKAYVEFGITLAQKGVWAGAIERFSRESYRDTYRDVFRGLGAHSPLPTHPSRAAT